MTVFLSIVQEFLIHEIQAIRDRSVKADSSMTNTALNWLGKGRDPKLSQDKRTIADELWPKIKGISEGKTDSDTLDAIKALLSEAKEKAAQFSREKHYDEGSFGPAMTTAVNFTDEIFKKISDAQFLDIPLDNDPLHQYCYHAAYYLVQKIDDKRHENTVEYVFQHPKLTNIRQLSEDKEKLILEKIRECREDLDTLDKSHPKYNETRRKRVVDSIDDLMRRNKELCKEHGIKWEIPVSVTFIASLNIGLPTLRPDSGFMEECMEKAREAIVQNEQQINPESASMTM